MDGTVWSTKSSRLAVIFTIHLCEKRNKPTLNRFLSIFSNGLCKQQREEKRWKQTDIYTASTRYWLRNVTYHSLDTYRNWRCLLGYRISRQLRLKTYLRCPTNYRPLNSASNVAELKHNSLKHDAKVNDLLEFKATSPFFCLRVLALRAIRAHCRTKSARIPHHNTLTVLCTWCTRFLLKAHKHISSQGLRQPNLNKQYYIEEI